MKEKPRRTKFSQEMVHRNRLGLSVQAGALRHAGTVAESAGKVLKRGLPAGEKMPDLRVIQIAIGNLIEQDLAELHQADESNLADLGAQGIVGDERDEHSKRAVEKLTSIRDAFDSVFGRGKCEQYLGLGTLLPVAPNAVLRIGLRTVEKLTSPTFKLPPRRSLGGVWFDLEQWVRELEPIVEGLDESLRGFNWERRDTDETQEAKNRLSERYDRNFGRYARFLEALYDLADRPHLARRLRPTSHTRGGGEPETPTTDDEPDAEGEPVEGASDADGESSTPARSEDRADPATVAVVKALLGADKT